MKTTRLLCLVLVSLFLVSFVSASSTYAVQHNYYDDNTHVKSVYYTFDKDYRENEYRYPISDYKEGYTYRVSKDYLEKKYEVDRDIYIKYNKRNENHNYERDNVFGRSIYSNYRTDYGKSSGKITYYSYVPYLNSYEEKTCYNSAPSGKLFYIKCDF